MHRNRISVKLYSLSCKFYKVKEVAVKDQKSRPMCLTLVWILFFLGMCSQITRADSLLVNLQPAAEESTIERVGLDGSSIEKCTYRLLNGLRESFRGVRRESQLRSNLRWNTHFLAVEDTAKIFWGFGCLAAAVRYQIQDSESIILDYIHQQDGEK